MKKAQALLLSAAPCLQGFSAFVVVHSDGCLEEASCRRASFSSPRCGCTTSWIPRYQGIPCHHILCGHAVKNLACIFQFATFCIHFHQAVANKQVTRNVQHSALFFQIPSRQQI